MRRVIWEADARRDLREGMRYLIDRDPFAAQRVKQRIVDAVALLAQRPIGRPSRLDGISQKLVLKTPYILAYRASESQLTILRVIHQSRDWTTGEWPPD